MSERNRDGAFMWGLGRWLAALVAIAVGQGPWPSPCYADNQNSARNQGQSQPFNATISIGREPRPDSPSYACNEKDSDWLAGCGTDYGKASARLSPGMTEQEVVAVVGSAPKSVSLEACGAKTGHLWQCKVYDYRREAMYLMVFFTQRSDGLWVVNSWNAD